MMTDRQRDVLRAMCSMAERRERLTIRTVEQATGLTTNKLYRALYGLQALGLVRWSLRQRGTLRLGEGPAPEVWATCRLWDVAYNTAPGIGCPR